MADPSLDALLAAMIQGGAAPDTRKRPEVPFHGPDGTYIERPQSTPGEGGLQWPLDPLNNPRRSAMGAIQGLLMSSGMTGGPSGAVTGAVKSAAEKVASSPAAQRLVAALGFGGALGAPSEAASPGDVAPKESVAPTQVNIDRLLERQAELSRQAKDALARRELERKSGEGPRLRSADAEYQGLNQQLNALNEQLAFERKRGS